MSFKREGDSANWLDSLKRRRVEELFSEDIPEDEALLMKNGRFCCLVCYHRPVFDTVSMLAVHRRGKKHVASAEQVEQDKLDLEVEKVKRRHALYQKNEPFPAHLHPTRATPGGLKKTDAYDPRLKKVRNSRHGRKTTLDLEAASSDVTAPETTPGNDLPGNRFSIKTAPVDTKYEAQTIADYRKHKQFINDAKNIEVKPYVKKNNRFFQQYANSVSKKSSEQGVHKDTCSAGQTMEYPVYTAPSESASCVQFTEHNANPAPEFKRSTAPLVFAHNHNKGRPNKAPKLQKELKHGPCISEEKQKRQEQYLHALGSGWLKDRDGNWVKDESVEFDSDEEPPDF